MSRRNCELICVPLIQSKLPRLTAEPGSGMSLALARLRAPIVSFTEPVSKHIDFVLIKELAEFMCGVDNASRASLGNSLVAGKDFQKVNHV